jgi:hypothetical protein
MSPEQAQGSKTIDARTDIYSLGVMLFEMLTGSLPFHADTPISLALAHISDPVPNILATNPGLPPAIETIIRRALAKDPAARYASAGALAADFSRVAAAQPPPGAAVPREATIIETGPVATYMPGSTPPPPPSMTAAPAYPPVATGAPAFPPPPPAAPRRSSNTMLYAVLGVVAVGALLVILALGAGALGLAMFFREPATPTRAAPTAQPSRTPAPTAEATSTSAPTEAPTATQPLPTEPPPTEPPPSNILFQDAFENQANGWDVYNSDNASAKYEGGEYVLHAIPVNWFVWGNPEGAHPSLSNARIEVTARSTGAATEPGFGIMCGYRDGDNTYYMGISVDGYYIIAKTVGGTDSVLSHTDSWTQSSAIPINAASYRLRADCGNGTLALYVNDSLLSTVNDTSFSSGMVGLFARTFAETNAEFRFDDLVVTSLSP